MKHLNKFVTFLLSSLILPAHGAPIPVQLVKNQVVLKVHRSLPFFAPSNSTEAEGQTFVFSCRSISIYQQVPKENDDFNFVFQVVRGCSDSEWEQALAKYQKKSDKTEDEKNNQTVPSSIHVEKHEKIERNSLYSSENVTTWIASSIIIIMTCLIIVCTLHLLMKRKKLTAQANMIRIFQNPVGKMSKGNDYI